MAFAVELSIVSPVYMGEKTVGPLVDALVEALTPISEQFEIVLVEDASPDASWAAIQEVAKREPRVRGLRLSRNFGQHNAICAGLDESRGEWVVVMDCDLQDRPQEIPRLLEAAKAGGHDLVLALREQRTDGFFKRAASRAFYAVLESLTEIKQDARVANFGVYHRRVIDVLVKDMREYVRYFPMMIRWVGFDVGTLTVEHGEELRPTTYSFARQLDLAFNIMLTFSDKPLRLTAKFGFVMTLCSALFGVRVAWQMFTGQVTVMGWTSLIVSIWFLGGVIVFILGVLGVYLGRVFDEVKRRPIYVVRERCEQEPA